MGLINWIFDIYQHSKIDEARKEAMEARLEASRIHRGNSIDVKLLENALGELALASKTVLRLLVEKGVCTSEELREALDRIDLEDGRADGKAPLP